jgi:hypothetical protein
MLTMDRSQTHPSDESSDQSSDQSPDRSRATPGAKQFDFDNVFLRKELARRGIPQEYADEWRTCIKYYGNPKKRHLHFDHVHKRFKQAKSVNDVAVKYGYERVFKTRRAADSEAGPSGLQPRRRAAGAEAGPSGLQARRRAAGSEAGPSGLQARRRAADSEAGPSGLQARRRAAGAEDGHAGLAGANVRHALMMADSIDLTRDDDEDDDDDPHRRCCICLTVARVGTDEYNDMLVIDPCNHIACNGCLAGYLTKSDHDMVFNKEGQLQCMQCKVLPHPTPAMDWRVLDGLQASGHITSQQMRTLSKLYVMYAMRHNVNSVSTTCMRCSSFCSVDVIVDAVQTASQLAADMTDVLNPYIFSCVDCGLMQCASCGVPATTHGERRSCQAYQASLKEIDQADVAAISAMNPHPCPGTCGQMLSKDFSYESCNVLTCHLCRLYMCALCGEKCPSEEYSKDDHSHVRATHHFTKDPLSKCFNAMWLTLDEWKTRNAPTDAV